MSISPRLLAAAALAVLGCATGAPAVAAPRTILVRFERPSSARAVAATEGDRLVTYSATRTAVIRVPAGMPVARVLAEYRARPDVVYAETNRLAHALLSPPNDPGFPSEWALAKTNALGGWAIYPGVYGGSNGPMIAVVDTGVQATHPDLAGRVRTDLGARCLSQTPCVADPAADDNGHGTHVAGIAAASTNNSAGVAGIAFTSPIIPVKVLGAGGVGWDVDIANGIVWAARKGAKVINLSLGGTYSRTECDAVHVAETYGALVVAAAGNDHTSTPVAPAACRGAVGVAATDELDRAAWFSNYGSPDVFVSAPGVNVWSTYLPNTYVYESGTSMAAPFVTGVAALRFGAFPGSSPADVRRVLASTADKIPGRQFGADPYSTCEGCTWASDYGYGRVDVAGALGAATPPPPTPSSGDTQPPTVHAYAGVVRRARIAKLRYRVGDDNGQTSERITVYRGRAVLKTYSRPLRVTDPAVPYWVVWRAPRPRGFLRFCVKATDGSGNTSTSCAPIQVR